MPVVKTHNGNGHVRSRARKYSYFISSVFVEKLTKDGRKIYVNSGQSSSPRRSFRLAQEDGIKLAEKLNISFVDGYGSLHNKSEGSEHGQFRKEN